MPKKREKQRRAYQTKMHEQAAKGLINRADGGFTRASTSADEMALAGALHTRKKKRPKTKGGD